jgi:hypothetical protein
MNEIRLVEPGDADEASDLAICKQIGAELEKAYPDHPWLISFQGRAIIIRHLAISNVVKMEMGRDGFGAVLPRKATDTPAGIVRSAREFGGRLLEAFGLKRGRWDGSKPILPNWAYKKAQGF